jgi:hypothetical protein
LNHSIPSLSKEPVPPENTAAMAALQRSTNMPIATGEGLQTQFNFYAILEKQGGSDVATGSVSYGRHYSDKKDCCDGRCPLRPDRAA